MRDKQIEKQFKRKRRHRRVRAKIHGTKEVPRLNVYRSNAGLFVQLIDDDQGKTLASVNNKEIQAGSGKNKKTKTEVAFEAGKLLAQKAKKLKVEKAVFDKGGFKYHGRVQAVADGAREEGLQF